jgi:hypothetical protein
MPIGLDFALAARLPLSARPESRRAIAQVPDEYRHGNPILVCADTARCTRGFLAHIRALRGHGLDRRFTQRTISLTVTRRPSAFNANAVVADLGRGDSSALPSVPERQGEQFAANRHHTLLTDSPHTITQVELATGATR